MQVSIYIQTPSLNNCSRGKAISITYTECVSVALVIQYVVHISRVVLGVPLATEPGISLIIVTPMKILQGNLNRSRFVV